MFYGVMRSVFRIMFAVMFRFRAFGMENIPAEGGVVLCANHRSNWDPPLLGVALERKVHYMAKAELFDIPVLGKAITALGAFPVKRGGVSKESIRLSLSLLRDGHVMGIFPEGSRHNAGGMGKKGAASLAIKSGATVIPAAIIGDYKPFRPMKVVYGRPVDLSDFAEGGSDRLEQATERIMSEIRKLAAQHESK
ncbi:lysophospholipid acyltransferase family protein [Paenibacillus ginsengihumi]|uniref:lysophospholipid acyltransferase family protein n=1 Tax=Paenibacillus ginsengihumi TaxID=431596 RepID=UPI00035C8E4C|nr:lysophospholipid acyltransferase family protein [Paenibacillus ginsengihumi]